MKEYVRSFGDVADKAPAMIWAADPDGLRNYFNKRWLDFTGRPASSELDGGWAKGVHPDDLSRCLAQYSGSFDRRQEFRMEYRLRRHDGEYRWVCETGVPWFEADGSFAGYVGWCFDITDAKLAEESLSRVSGRLIEAHDQEGLRVARELHEDIGAALAVVGIELIRAGQPDAGLPGQKQPDLQEIYKKLQEIGLRISRLSNELNPPMLRYFGLARAIETECQEYSKACRIPIACSCNNIPPRLSGVVALNFFRVVQEALRNVCRHSRATSASVNVAATSNELTLLVSDDGAGFDMEQIHRAAGLGLVVMRERMRLIGGELEIRSRPGQGARISCRAPLVPS
jgi:PAS domain S-box-containing protein